MRGAVRGEEGGGGAIQSDMEGGAREQGRVARLDRSFLFNLLLRIDKNYLSFWGARARAREDQRRAAHTKEKKNTCCRERHARNGGRPARRAVRVARHHGGERGVPAVGHRRVSPGRGEVVDARARAPAAAAVRRAPHTPKTLRTRWHCSLPIPLASPRQSNSPDKRARGARRLDLLLSRPLIARARARARVPLARALDTPPLTFTLPVNAPGQWRPPRSTATSTAPNRRVLLRAR